MAYSERECIERCRVLLNGTTASHFMLQNVEPHPIVFMGVRLAHGETRLFSVAATYGWPVDQPEPEKSPAEKALDDFIAKRKAKRDTDYGPDQSHWDRLNEQDAIEDAQSRDLDRAMQKLAPHQTNFHDRVVPYRGPVL